MKIESFTSRCVKNRYFRIYMEICKRAALRSWKKSDAPCYVEMHHIVPKSIIPNNRMVALTANEHLICHILLTKFLSGEDRAKMLFAVSSMMNYDEYDRKHITSRLYQNIKEAHAAHLNEKMTGYSKPWQDKINKNPEKIRKTAEKHRGMKRSEEAKDKMRTAKIGYVPWNKGKSGSMTGIPKKKVTCIHCGAEMSATMMTRTHSKICTGI